jgi:enamidase
MPLAMLHLMAELVSLGGLTADLAVAAATGNVGRAYRLDAGILEIGRPAGPPRRRRAARIHGRRLGRRLEAGDMPAISAAVTSGRVRFTPQPQHPGPETAVTQLSRSRRPQ